MFKRTGTAREWIRVSEVDENKAVQSSCVVNESRRRISSASNAGSQFAQHAVTDGQLAFLIGIRFERHAVLIAVTRLWRRSEFGVECRFRIVRMVARRQLQQAVLKNCFRRGVEASTFERREGRLRVVLTAKRVDRDGRVWPREVLVRFLATVISHVWISA